jgi:hypothetical protein
LKTQDLSFSLFLLLIGHGGKREREKNIEQKTPKKKKFFFVYADIEKGFCTKHEKGRKAR